MTQVNSRLLQASLDEGLRAHSEGRLDVARDAYTRALRLAPDHPDALQLLGSVWLQLGDAKQAAGCLERAARKLRNHPGVIGNLAHAYFELGRYDEARETYRKASRLDPRNVYFQMGVANCLGMQGRLAEAETGLRRLADRFPGVALVWLNLGNALRQQNRLQDALLSYQKALELDPGSAEAHNDLGSVLHGLYRFDEAERQYRACLAIDPAYIPAQYNRASVLIDVGQFREAEALCRQIINRTPTVPQAHTFLGAALGHQGRLLEAMRCHRRAAELAPQDVKAVENYAAALADIGHFDEALKWFLRALSLSPESVSAHQLLGTALLTMGRMTEGWIEYAHRPAFARFREKYSDVPLVQTLPRQLAGKHVFLTREQGLGDEIFFLRYAQQLSAAGVRVTYRASRKIRSLLDRVDCLAEVLDETAPIPSADAIMMAGDLPHAISDYASSALPNATTREPETSLPEVPSRISVFWPPIPSPLKLKPLADCLDTIRKQLAAVGSAPYIGISWRAGTRPREQRGGPSWSLHKEIRIDFLARILREVPGTFISLQRNPGSGENEHFSRIIGREMHDFSVLNDDLESMLALLALIDEYVGVSNTNMHLRAGAGRTARVLVPCPAEWRWMAAGPSSPWFPGFSIYRQSPDGDWSAALARLREDLNRL